MKKKFIYFICLISFFLVPQIIFASGFQLKTLGALDLDGVTVDHIWYSAQNPTITGIAPASSEVKITVDGVDQQVTADSSGNWIFHPTLIDGDHTLVFTNAGSTTITKTITIGNIPENIGALPKAETPTVGNITPTIIFLTIGIILLISSPIVYFRKR